MRPEPPNLDADPAEAGADELLIHAFNFLKSRQANGRNYHAVLEQEGVKAPPEVTLQEGAHRLARLWRKRREARPAPEEAARLIADYIARHGVTKCPPAILGRLGIELDLGFTAPLRRPNGTAADRHARAKRAGLKGALACNTGRPRK